ncbi:hypothetical protein GWK90_07035, partial [Candidatus Hamiltonella defensa]
DFGEKFYQQQKNNFTKEGIQYVHSLNSELTKLAGEYLALGQIIFISKDETSNLKLSKVYVLGHGSAGDKNIYDTARSDSQTKSAADLVGELKELIKIDQSIDIRLTSCESADAYTIRSFKNTESDKNKKNLCEIKPLAEHVRNECNNQKVEAKVYGYHGDGVSGGSGYYNKIRCLAHQPNVRMRASQVRAEFD